MSGAVSSLFCQSVHGVTHLLDNARFNLIEGKNGQGKTNLLEAVYLLGALRSPREAKNPELIRFGAERAVVIGEYHREPA